MTSQFASTGSRARFLAGAACLALLAGPLAAWADSEPPSPVADLSASAPARAAQLHVVLNWTAPEEQNGGPTGQPAATYDIRVSPTPILSDLDFNAATPVTANRTADNTIPSPAAPGTPQSLEVLGLSPATQYHFAIKSSDASGNTSALSNAPSRSTAGYEGYAYAARGGGDGTVCRVSSLADSGAGTLRNCVLPAGGRACASEPLTVVFDVGGSITLMSDILLDADDCRLTIDGSTAPAPGVTIRKQACQAGLSACPVGHACLQNGEFKIGANRSAITEDIILTYLRFRGNYELAWGACLENSGATLGLQYHFDKILIDHLTIRNGVDSAPDMWSGQWDSSNVNISNTLMAWSNHPLTISDSGAGGSRSNISVHHNVFARSGERMPQVRYKTTNFDYRNNVVFDWRANNSGSYGMRIRNDEGQSGTRKVSANVVKNYFINGNGNPRNAYFYANGPGSEGSTSNGDGGPPSCKTSDGCANCPAQGAVVTTSYMGELWVSGNVFPDEVCDRWSTVSNERNVPVAAQVDTDDAANLGITLLPAVGTVHRSADEQGLLDEIAAKMGVSGPVCGNGVKETGEACDGNDFGSQTCQDFGFDSGALACTSGCGVDTTNCTVNVPPGDVGGLTRTDKR